MSLKNTIFYSWQSDLPNKSNRTFLENCLKNVVEELKSLGDFGIELNLDRDTLDTTGTPNIVDTIFRKIEQAQLFVADISIIDPETQKRKTPNPNVLIELGFAARALGWEKIICLYNMDYGNYDDLPFDLKQRRPLGYSLKDKTKADVQKNIVQTIVKNIKSLYESGLLFDTVSDFLKVQVDTEILTIVGYFYKMLFGYDQAPTFRNDAEFLFLTDDQIREKLTNTTFIGFQIFKKFTVIEDNLKRIVNLTLSSAHHQKEISAIIIEFISWVERYDKYNSLRTKPAVFHNVGGMADDFKALKGTDINSNNTKLPDRFILLKKLDEERSQVKDFGDFIEAQKIQGLLHHFRINKIQIERYVALIRSFIKLTERWLDMTNGEFIVDNVKMFETHPVK